MSLFGLKDLGTKIAITALGFFPDSAHCAGGDHVLDVRRRLPLQGSGEHRHPGRKQAPGHRPLPARAGLHLRTLASSHSVEDLSSPDMLENILSTMQLSSKTFIDLGLINEEGVHVSYSGPYNLSQANYKNEQWFNEAMVRKVYVSDVFEGFRGFPHMIIAVTKQERGKVWILRATIDSDIFDSLVRWLQLGDLGDAYLVNRPANSRPGRGSATKAGRPTGLSWAARFQGPRSRSSRTGKRTSSSAASGWSRRTGSWSSREDMRGELQPLFQTQAATWGVMGGGVALIHHRHAHDHAHDRRPAGPVEPPAGAAQRGARAVEQDGRPGQAGRGRGPRGQQPPGGHSRESRMDEGPARGGGRQGQPQLSGIRGRRDQDRAARGEGGQRGAQDARLRPAHGARLQ